jgi:hypothetical protein
VFNRFDLGEELGRGLGAAESAVDKMEPDLLLRMPVADVVAALVDEYGVEPLRILWDEAGQLPTEECQVDKGHDFRYGDPDRRGPLMVAAARVTIAVPVVRESRLLGGRRRRFPGARRAVGPL